MDEYDSAAGRDKEYDEALNEKARGMRGRDGADVPPFMRERVAFLKKIRNSRFRWRPSTYGYDPNKYSPEVVEEFVGAVEETLPPGAFMALFVILATGHEPMLGSFDGRVQNDMRSFYGFWLGVNGRTRSNILDKMRIRLYEEQHKKYVEAFHKKARAEEASGK